jgi:hypothetical protein
MFLDCLAEREMGLADKITYEVTTYALPTSLNLRSAEELMLLSLYLESTSPEGDAAVLPSTFWPEDVIVAKEPALVETLYRVRGALLPWEEVALHIPMKKVWLWQEAHRDEIDGQYPDVRLDREQPWLAVLGRLSLAQQEKIHTYARRQMLAEDPRWIQQAFELVPCTESDLHLYSDGRVEWNQSLLSEHLGHLLEKCDLEALQYHMDGDFCLRIESMNKIQDRSALTFEEAKTRRRLQALAREKLKQQYETLKYPFVHRFYREGEGWMSYDEAKDQVTAILFASKLADGSTWSRRCMATVQAAFLELQTNPFNKRWVVPFDHEITENRLQGQFRFVTQTVEVGRTYKEKVMRDEVFALYPKRWSGLREPKVGEVLFFHIGGQKEGLVPLLEPILISHAALAQDAEYHFAKALLKKFAESDPETEPLEDVPL